MSILCSFHLLDSPKKQRVWADKGRETNRRQRRRVLLLRGGVLDVIFRECRGVSYPWMLQCLSRCGTFLRIGGKETSYEIHEFCLPSFTVRELGTGIVFSDDLILDSQPPWPARTFGLENIDARRTTATATIVVAAVLATGFLGRIALVAAVLHAFEQESAFREESSTLSTLRDHVFGEFPTNGLDSTEHGNDGIVLEGHLTGEHFGNDASQ